MGCCKRFSVTCDERAHCTSVSFVLSFLVADVVLGIFDILKQIKAHPMQLSRDTLGDE